MLSYYPSRSKPRAKPNSRNFVVGRFFIGGEGLMLRNIYKQRMLEKLGVSNCYISQRRIVIVEWQGEGAAIMEGRNYKGEAEVYKKGEGSNEEKKD